MTARLTITLNAETIKRTKALSAKTGKSISEIVEEYLNSITQVSAVSDLDGLLKGKLPNDMTWKDIKARYVKEKYGV